MTIPCKILSWDSDFFGFSVAKVTSPILDFETAVAIDSWAKENKIKCLYFFSSDDNYDTIKFANDFNYKLVDIRVGYEQKINFSELTSEKTDIVREYKESDFPALQEIARNSFFDSRFYYDPHFKKDDCDKMYEIWLRKNIDDKAAVTYVVETDNIPVGFVTCSIEANTARIELISINQKNRVKGLGTLLTQAALFKLISQNQNIKKVVVYTQLRNVSAQRLYQRCNFLLSEYNYCYHKWF